LDNDNALLLQFCGISRTVFGYSHPARYQYLIQDTSTGNEEAVKIKGIVVVWRRG
jgi:hypothetical protein